MAGAGNNNRWYLQVTSQENENVTYTLTRMDTDQVIDAVYDGYWNIDNTDITGSVMFRIDAAVNKGTYTDITTKYLLVEKDDTAPMLSLDQTVVYANKDTGDYTITGMTEPNGTVCLDDVDWEGNLKQVATADENGRFSYSGQLDLTYNQMVMDEEGMPVYDENGNPVIQTIRTENGMFLLLVAEDANGNRSAAESVVVTLEDHDWEADYTVDQEPTCKDEGMKSIHCKTCSAVKDEQTIPAAGHSWGVGVITIKPTAEKTGIRTYLCERCGATKTEEVDKISVPDESKPDTSDKPSGSDGTKPENVDKISGSNETKAENVNKTSASGKTEADKKTAGEAVRTDDNARMMLWITILILSTGTGAITITVRRKTKRK